MTNNAGHTQVHSSRFLFYSMQSDNKLRLDCSHFWLKWRHFGTPKLELYSYFWEEITYFHVSYNVTCEFPWLYAQSCVQKERCTYGWTDGWLGRRVLGSSCMVTERSGGGSSDYTVTVKLLPTLSLFQLANISAQAQRWKSTGLIRGATEFQTGLKPTTQTVSPDHATVDRELVVRA